MYKVKIIISIIIKIKIKKLHLKIFFVINNYRDIKHKN